MVLPLVGWSESTEIVLISRPGGFDETRSPIRRGGQFTYGGLQIEVVSLLERQP